MRRWRDDLSRHWSRRRRCLSRTTPRNRSCRRVGHAHAYYRRTAHTIARPCQNAETDRYVSCYRAAASRIHDEFDRALSRRQGQRNGCRLIQRRPLRRHLQVNHYVRRRRTIRRNRERHLLALGRRRVRRRYRQRGTALAPVRLRLCNHGKDQAEQHHQHQPNSGRPRLPHCRSDCVTPRTPM